MFSTIKLTIKDRIMIVSICAFFAVLVYYFDNKQAPVSPVLVLPLPVATTTVAQAQMFGQPVLADINGDGKLDKVYFTTEEPGGSGTFFYVTAEINENGKFVKTNSIFLGDRIAPQNIVVGHDGIIDANYAVRKDSEPMTTAPSVGKTTYATFVKGNLVEMTR